MFLLINKPAGPTSHDIINQLRRITGLKKIGHAGTLDPFASGLLIIAVGREATREINQFVKLDKEYVATIKLGAVSDTYDKTGKITPIPPSSFPIPNAITTAVKSFLGPQLQTPPMYSAQKIGGQKLYQLARQGKEINRGANSIEIYNLEILSYNFPLLKIKVACSSGTYIRSLAHDLGKKLGGGGYLEELVRTKIGPYKLEDAISLKQLTPGNWQNFTFQK
jgi:tRNA pseudouridine55 synthase